MTMSVTTPIAPTTVSSDAGATAVPGGQSATEGEFADALAGFLDGGPGTQTPGTGEAEGAADGDPAQAVDATTAAAQMMATVAPLWAAATVPAAVPGVPAPAPVTDAASDPQTGVSAPGSLAAAVAPLTSTPAAIGAGADQPGQPATTGVTVGVSDERAPAALSPIASSAAAEAVAAGSNPASAAHPAAPSSGEGIDVHTAASALGLTLVAAEQSATDTGAGTGSGAASPAPTGEGATAGMADAPLAATGPTAAAPTSGALAASAPAATAPRPVHVAHQFATQVATLAGAANGVHTMTIQITPDDLGPVQVQVTLTDGAVDMTVLTALEVGRDTIAQAAPDLRRYLEAAGLTCNNVEVDLSNDQSSWLAQPDAEQNFEERKSANGREQAGTPSGDIDDSPTAGAATRSPSSTSSGVDLQM